MGARWVEPGSPAVAEGQGDEQIGRGDVDPEPRHQTVFAVATGSTAPLAIDAHEVQGKFTEQPSSQPLAKTTWRVCDAGFNDINAFMDSHSLDKFKVIVDDPRRSSTVSKSD
jgi:hypothetical protein